jgi:uncharacterized protein (TIGR04255 family)
MTYNYTHYKLHQDPLSLVLCQVKFSKVRKMPELIPQIYDLLRKEGFPEDASSTVQQIVITPGNAPQIIERKQDEFRSKDNKWSLTISEDMLVLVTTAYDRFEGFADRLKRSLEIVDQVAEINQGLVNRIGLRYVDVINPQHGETFRNYLQPSLHGPTSSVFTDLNSWLHLESVGRTALGTMIVRITQNDQGVVLPPDIIHKPMTYKMKVETGKLITLVDSDHFVEGSWDYDLANIINTTSELHEAINAAWFNDLVTQEALTIWGAEHVES